MVVLRHFTLADVDDVTAACQDEEIVRWTATIPTPYTTEDARAWIESQPARRAAGTGYSFAIAQLGSPRMCGTISVNRRAVDSEVPPSIGYWIAPWGRRRGLASHALNLVSLWAFTALPADRLRLVTMLGNVGSERVAKNGGFTMFGQLDDWAPRSDPASTRQVKVWERAAAAPGKRS